MPEMKEERGAVLLEAALGVFIVLGIALFVGAFLDRLHRLKQEQTAAAFFDRAHAAAEAYGRGPWLREDFAGFSDLVPGAQIDLGVAELKDAALLPASFPERDVFGSGLLIRFSAGRSGPRALLRMAVMTSGGPPLPNEAAGRMVQVIRGWTGHVRGVGATAEIVFPGGVSLAAAALPHLGGAAPAEGALLAVKEWPLDDRLALTRILEDHINPFVREYEVRMNERLAAFDFTAANADRDLSLKPVIYRPEGDLKPDFYHPEGKESWEALETEQHICPGGFVPTIQFYPEAAGNADIAGEVRERRYKEARHNVAVRSGDDLGFTLIAPVTPSWRAVGIFRTISGRDPAPGQPAPVLHATRPVNTEVVSHFDPVFTPRTGPGGRQLSAFYQAVRYHRWASGVLRDGEKWIVPHLPIRRRPHSAPEEAVKLFDFSWEGRKICRDLDSCELDGSQEPWGYWNFEAKEHLADIQVGTMELVYGYGSNRCSVAMYTAEGVAARTRDLENTPGPHFFTHGDAVINPWFQADLCDHLGPSEISVIRKCVPDTGHIHQGFDLALTPPAREED